MTSILDFSTQELCNKFIAGTNERKTYSEGGYTYELGTDYPCPRSAPFSYSNSVSVEDFDVKNLVLEAVVQKPKTSKGTERKFISYQYCYGDTTGPLNISVKHLLTSNYGLQLPIADVFGTVPPGYKTPKYFDMSLSNGTPSANCTITVDFTSSYMHRLNDVFEQIKLATARFFRDRKGDDVLEKNYKSKLDKKKYEGASGLTDLMDDLNFGETLTTKTTKDGNEVRLKYIDLFTVYNRDKNNEKNIKMAVKTRFFSYDKQGGQHDIHPSMCLRNKIEYSPIIYIQKSMHGKTNFNLKMFMNEIVVHRIFQYGGGNPTPVATSKSMFELFMNSGAGGGEETPAKPKMIFHSDSDEEQSKPPPVKSQDTDSEVDAPPPPKSSKKASKSKSKKNVSVSDSD